MPGAGPVPLPSAPFTPNTEDKHAVGKKKRTFCLFWACHRSKSKILKT